VCPWNKKAKPHKNPEFELPAEVGLMTAETGRTFPGKIIRGFLKHQPSEEEPTADLWITL